MEQARRNRLFLKTKSPAIYSPGFFFCMFSFVL